MSCLWKRRGLELDLALEAETMSFPMYTMAAPVLLKMAKLEPHEIVKERGEVVIFQNSMGHAAFVSHQWVSRDHPDPDFQQMQVLQDALRRILYSEGCISPDFGTEAYVASAKGISFLEFQSKALFFWYDYFSVPQLELREVQATEADGSEQAKAISSIPAYVARCRYFLALCPTIACPLEARVLNARTWAGRGWCRLERATRELSEHDSWIVIRSAAALEVVGAMQAFGMASVGQGAFSVEADRMRLAPVMKTIVRRKLILALRAGDWPAYRRQLNLQAVRFRGLEVEPFDLIEANGSSETVAQFLHQNGLSCIDRRDAAGWWPLHYAALSGSLELVQGLLEEHADLNQRTSRAEPQLGIPALVSALDLAVFHHHNEVARWLIAAKAELKGGREPALHVAAMAENVEGIRLLCEAGSNPLEKNLFGLKSFETAAGCGAGASVEELWTQSYWEPLDLSRALWGAMAFRGGSELAQRLIEWRADVDFQYKLSRELSCYGRLRVAVKPWQPQRRAMSALAYHVEGQTPLMAAVQSGQYEGAATLIAQGARLDTRNCRGWTAADFARDPSIPGFLQRGLAGDPSECQRVHSLALSDGFVEMQF